MLTTCVRQTIWTAKTLVANSHLNSMHRIICPRTRKNLHHLILHHLRIRLSPIRRSHLSNKHLQRHIRHSHHHHLLYEHLRSHLRRSHLNWPPKHFPCRWSLLNCPLNTLRQVVCNYQPHHRSCQGRGSEKTIRRTRTQQDTQRVPSSI